MHNDSDTSTSKNSNKLLTHYAGFTERQDSSMCHGKHSFLHCLHLAALSLSEAARLELLSQQMRKKYSEGMVVNTLRALYDRPFNPTLRIIDTRHMINEDVALLMGIGLLPRHITPCFEIESQ